MKPQHIIYLLAIYAFYSTTSIFTKLASTFSFLSWQYILSVIGAVSVLGIFAIIWQQVLKYIPLATAYMFKGSSIIFVLLFSVLLFGESISLNNIIGAVIIVIGITLFAKA